MAIPFNLQRLRKPCDQCLTAQIEDSYSPRQLEALDEYTQRAQWYRVLGVCVAMIAPSALLVFLLNLIPLQAPSAILKGNANFFIRSYIGSVIGTVGVAMQVHAGVPAAGLTPAKIALIAIFSALGFTGTITLLTKYWVFPVTWSILFAIQPWSWLFVASVLLGVEKARFDTKPGLKKQLTRFAKVLTAQACLVVVYPSFNAVHVRLVGLNQLVFLALLPVMKFVTKRMVAIAAGKDSGEIAPALLANMDIFDALYLSKSMQNTASLWTGAGLVAIDLLESVFVIVRLQKLAQLGQTDSGERLIDTMKRACSSGSPVSPAATNVVSDVSRAKVAAADSRIATAEQRTSLVKCGTGKPLAGGKRVHPSSKWDPSDARRASTGVVATFSESKPGQSNLSTAGDSRCSSEGSADAMQNRLWLFYKFESLLLAEYIECVIPFTYAIYLTTLFHLSNDVLPRVGEPLEREATSDHYQHLHVRVDGAPVSDLHPHGLQAQVQHIGFPPARVCLLEQNLVYLQSALIV